MFITVVIKRRQRKVRVITRLVVSWLVRTEYVTKPVEDVGGRESSDRCDVVNIVNIVIYGGTRHVANERRVGNTAGVPSGIRPSGRVRLSAEYVIPSYTRSLRLWTLE